MPGPLYFHMYLIRWSFSINNSFPDRDTAAAWQIFNSFASFVHTEKNRLASNRQTSMQKTVQFAGLTQEHSRSLFVNCLKKCKKTGHAGKMCTLDRTSYFVKAGAVRSLRKCTFFDMIHSPSITILRSSSRRLLQVAEVILNGAERTERCAEA